MDDRTHVLDAYAKLVEQLFAVFFSSYTGARGDATEEAAAEQRFKAGLVHARHIRDRALALLS